jgi:hypothetical protein
MIWTPSSRSPSQVCVIPIFPPCTPLPSLARLADHPPPPECCGQKFRVHARIWTAGWPSCAAPCAPLCACLLCSVCRRTLCGLYLHPEAHPGGYQHLRLASFHVVPGFFSRLVVEASAECLHVHECCWARVALMCPGSGFRSFFGFFARSGCCRPAAMFCMCFMRCVGPVPVEIRVLVRMFTPRTPLSHN